MRILVVEDDRKVARFVRQGLEEEGHAVDVAPDGEEGAILAHVNPYDVLVLDVQLPKKNGLQLAAELRREGSIVPILMLTARDSTEDVVRAASTAAPTTTSPSRSRSTSCWRGSGLLADVGGSGSGGGAAVRRRGGGPGAAPRHPRRPRARSDAREFRLLEHFLERPDDVANPTEPLEKVWDMSFDPGTNVVDVHVSNLRRKLEDGGARRLIQTVRGVGFALRRDEP